MEFKHEYGSVTQDEMIARMRDAGFNDVEIQDHLDELSWCQNYIENNLAHTSRGPRQMAGEIIDDTRFDSTIADAYSAVKTVYQEHAKLDLDPKFYGVDNNGWLVFSKDPLMQKVFLAKPICEEDNDIVDLWKDHLSSKDTKQCNQFADKEGYRGLLANSGWGCLASALKVNGDRWWFDLDHAIEVDIAFYEEDDFEYIVGDNYDALLCFDDNEIRRILNNAIDELAYDKEGQRLTPFSTNKNVEYLTPSNIAVKPLASLDSEEKRCYLFFKQEGEGTFACISETLSSATMAQVEDKNSVSLLNVAMRYELNTFTPELLAEYCKVPFVKEDSQQMLAEALATAKVASCLSTSKEHVRDFTR